jgi:hypothetical protein
MSKRLRHGRIGFPCGHTASSYNYMRRPYYALSPLPRLSMASVSLSYVVQSAISRRVARHGAIRPSSFSLRRRCDDGIYTGEQFDAAVPSRAKHVALPPVTAMQRRRDSRDASNGDRTMTARKRGRKVNVEKKETDRTLYRCALSTVRRLLSSAMSTDVERDAEDVVDGDGTRLRERPVEAVRVAAAVAATTQ